MPQVQFWNGAVLFDSGVVAMDPACCCVVTPTCPTDCSAFATKIVKFIVGGPWREQMDDGLGHCVAYTCDFDPCEGDGYVTGVATGDTLESAALTRDGCTWSGGTADCFSCDQGDWNIDGQIWCDAGIWYCRLESGSSQYLLFAREDDGSHSPAGVYELIERPPLDCIEGAPTLEVTVEDAP